jgi:hypothetical protein
MTGSDTIPENYAHESQTMDLVTAAGTCRAAHVGAELDGRFEEMSLCLRRCPSIPVSSACNTVL